jgi:hypothetical protein
MDEQRQLAARVQDYSFDHGAAISPVVATLLLQACRSRRSPSCETTALPLDEPPGRIAASAMGGPEGEVCYQDLV